MDADSALSNDIIQNLLPIFTKFCMWLGNVVDSTFAVSMAT